MRLVRSPLLKQTAPCLGHAVQLTTAKPLPHVVFHVLYFLALLLSTAFLIPSLACSCCHKALYYYPLVPPTASPPALLYYQTIVPFTVFIQAITTSPAGSVPPNIFFRPRCHLCAVMYIQLVWISERYIFHSSSDYVQKCWYFQYKCLLLQWTGTMGDLADG